MDTLVQALPGCGLKATVTQVEDIVNHSSKAKQVGLQKMVCTCFY